MTVVHDTFDRANETHFGATWTPFQAAVFGQYVGAITSHRPLTRWERTLVWFGLKRDPRPFTDTFTWSWSPTILGPSARYVEVWGDWDWVDG